VKFTPIELSPTTKPSILTKAIGTGLVTTAAKRATQADVAPNGWLHPAYEAAVASMIRLNDVAANIARTHRVSAGTDITGFGLLGHLHRVAAASGVQIRIDVDQVPVLPGIPELIERGTVPGGTDRNLQYVSLFMAANTDPDVLSLLADPQTSGGLALCTDADKAQNALAELLATGHAAAIIGSITEQPATGHTLLLK
jgi:selenide, water dikinase